MTDQCIILAGGVGSRLGKITKKTPKPLINVNNKPFINYIIKNFYRQGIRNFLILTWYKNHLFIKNLNNNFKDAKIKIVKEKKKLGTAGALRNSINHLKENFFVTNGDTFFDINIRDLEFKTKKNFSKIGVALKSSLEYKNNLSYKINSKKIVTSYKKNKKRKKLVCGGIYYLNKKVVKKLKKENYIYEGKLDVPKGEQTKDWKIRNQLLFKSTLFGDDTDRALQKADGSWTYFAADVAYHSYKVSRKFDVLINILGADHAGYIKRITSATNAISKNKVNLICKVSQLVKLFKNGKPFKMSKRKGDYITVEDLIKEVGKDSTRFMMLNRSNDVELDFDFEKVTEKSKDNPVFYVQYGYARINSIFRLLKLDLKKNIKLDAKNFTLNRYEIEILKKISEWPKCVEISSSRLEPHRIPFYLYELVTLFHSYWNLGKDNKEFRFVQEHDNLNKPRLVVLQALSIVIKNGMFILGVSAPRSM